MAFTGWPVEGVEFYEGLEADNTRTYWHANKAVYDECVKAPMEALLAELAPAFGEGRIFRPNRDTRFSKDKTPYKLNCAATMPGGYVSFSADELFVGARPVHARAGAAPALQGSGGRRQDRRQLEAIVATLRKAKYDVGAREALKTAPKGVDKDHPRIELLRRKGIVMSRSWPVGAWLGTRKAKDRVVAGSRRPARSWPGSTGTSADPAGRGPRLHDDDRDGDLAALRAANGEGRVVHHPARWARGPRGRA